MPAGRIAGIDVDKTFWLSWLKNKDRMTNENKPPL